MPALALAQLRRCAHHNDGGLLSRLEYFPEAFSAIAVSSLIWQGRKAERPAKQLVAVLLVQTGLVVFFHG
jgi:hypothetical protein